MVLRVADPTYDEQCARLSDMYVEVVIVRSEDVQPAPMDDDAMPRPYEPVDVLAAQATPPITSTSARGPIHPADLFQPRTRRVLLKGQPGMGKTTFLNKLCTDWCAGLLPMFDWVFLLPLRDLSDGDCRSKQSLAEVLHTQLRECMPRGFTHEDLDELMNESPSRVLILLDGYDEFDPACCPVINDFIRGTNTSRRLVLTTRPSALESLEALTCRPGKPFDTKADVLGFGPGAQEEYAGKFFSEPQHADMAASLRTQLQSSMMLRGLLQSPLMLRFACALTLNRWTPTSSTEALPRTITKLFTEINKYKIECAQQDLGGSVTRGAIDDALAQLQELAWWGIEQGRLHFSLADLAARGIDVVAGAPLPLALQLGFLQRKMRGGGGGRGTTVTVGEFWCFPHLAMQENLAACWLVSNGTVMTIFETLGGQGHHDIAPRFDMVWRFASGLLKETGARELIQAIVCAATRQSTRRLTIVTLQCIAEAASDVTEEQAVGLRALLQPITAEGKLDLADSSLSRLDMCNLAEVLPTLTLMSLNLSANTLDDEMATTLAGALVGCTALRRVVYVRRGSETRSEFMFAFLLVYSSGRIATFR